MVIQAIGLINPNQAEKSRRHFNEDLVDWISMKSILKKAQLCFKALPTQGPLDPICLGFEVRIR